MSKNFGWFCAFIENLNNIRIWRCLGNLCGRFMAASNFYIRLLYNFVCFTRWLYYKRLPPRSSRFLIIDVVFVCLLVVLLTVFTTKFQHSASDIWGFFFVISCVVLLWIQQISAYFMLNFIKILQSLHLTLFVVHYVHGYCHTFHPTMFVVRFFFHLHSGRFSRGMIIFVIDGKKIVAFFVLWTKRARKTLLRSGNSFLSFHFYFYFSVLKSLVLYI